LFSPLPRVRNALYDVFTCKESVAAPSASPTNISTYGALPKVISEALGHSSVAFTMDVYSHIIEGMQQDAMMLLDRVLLPKAKNGVFAKK